MYGAPTLTPAMADAFAPSRRKFWDWYKANAVQGDLFSSELNRCGRVEDGGFIVPLAQSGIPEPSGTLDVVTLVHSFSF
jgi:hypothetical protein